MSDKDLRIRADELHRLGIGCEHCKSEIIFEATAERGPGETLCPNCSTPMSNVGSIVAAYRTFFCQVSKVKAQFLVRIDD